MGVDEEKCFISESLGPLLLVSTSRGKCSFIGEGQIMAALIISEVLFVKSEHDNLRWLFD